MVHTQWWLLLAQRGAHGCESAWGQNQTCPTLRLCAIMQRRDNPLWSPSSSSPPHTRSNPIGSFSQRAKAPAVPAADGTGDAAEGAAQDDDADSIVSAADANELCGGTACMLRFSQLKQRLQQQSAVIKDTQVRCLRLAWSCHCQLHVQRLSMAVGSLMRLLPSRNILGLRLANSVHRCKHTIGQSGCWSFTSTGSGRAEEVTANIVSTLRNATAWLLTKMCYHNLLMVYTVVYTVVTGGGRAAGG